MTDRWGTWVSGLVPITDPNTGEIIALLGTDIDSRDWTIQIIIASAPAVIAMLLLLLLLLIFYYVLQRNERERQILSASEAVVKESERRLTDIINFLPDATLVIDKEGKIISWNKAMEEMTGVPADAMLGKGDHEYSIPFYGERRPILIDLVFDENEEIKKKYPFIQKEGDKFFSEIFIQRLFGGRVPISGSLSLLSMIPVAGSPVRLKRSVISPAGNWWKMHSRKAKNSSGQFLRKGSMAWSWSMKISGFSKSIRGSARCSVTQRRNCSPCPLLILPTRIFFPQIFSIYTDSWPGKFPNIQQKNGI